MVLPQQDSCRPTLPSHGEQSAPPNSISWNRLSGSADQLALNIAAGGPPLAPNFATGRPSNDSSDGWASRGQATSSSLCATATSKRSNHATKSSARRCGFRAHNHVARLRKVDRFPTSLGRVGTATCRRAAGRMCWCRHRQIHNGAAAAAARHWRRRRRHPSAVSTAAAPSRQRRRRRRIATLGCGGRRSRTALSTSRRRSAAQGIAQPSPLGRRYRAGPAGPAAPH